MTSILIEMEAVVEGDYLLSELVQILSEVVEKVETESYHHLVRATACDCLREIELAFPGILSSKLGHFYALSQAENSHIFQHYLLLLSTVLDHTVKKCVLALELGHTPDPALSELLSQGESLGESSLPADFRENANLLLSKPSSVLERECSESPELRRAVSFILTHYQLLTPPCLALTLHNVLSTIEFTSLSPMIFKGMMLHYQSCQELLCFHLVLCLKWRFGDDICSQVDADSIHFWFTLMAAHPSLPHYQRELMLSYFLEWPHDHVSPSQPPTTDSEGETDEPRRSQTGTDRPDYRQILSPTVFDTYSIYYYKIKALNFRLTSESNDDDLSSSLPQLLSTVLSQAKYGISGAPVTTLFRLLFAYYPLHTSSGSELCQLVTELVRTHPNFIPHMIDFISSIENAFPNSPVPLQLLADYLDFVSSSPLLPNLPLFLLFLPHAAKHPSINPLVVIQFLTRVVRDKTLCEVGAWSTGSAILNIINTILRTHPTNSIFKGLTHLLELVSTNYKDIDVQDRARFYHQLIVSVSGDKLVGILSLASDGSAGSTLSDIVEARIADNTFPSAPPVQIISEPFLSLNRVNSCEERFYNDEADHLSGEGAEEEKATFSLQYLVQFVKCPERVSSQIFAVVLRLSTDGPYHSCPDVYIPCLSSKASGAATKSTEKIVMFTFFPKHPVPAVFRARVIFTTDEGVTCVCELGNIEVKFEDLLQPLPQSLIPQQVCYKQLFLQLWSKLESSQNTTKRGGEFSLLSTVHLDIGWKEWENASERLQLLLVPTSNGEEGACYLVFLPPRYRLLMRARRANDREGGVDVWLATDYWRGLGLVNDYLLQMSGRTGTQLRAWSNS
jgi:AP-5 complex subunit beta-1